MFLKNKIKNNNHGSMAILLTMLVLFFIITISLIVARIMVQEIRISRDISGSFKAYSAAIGGIERGSFKVKENLIAGFPASNGFAGIPETFNNSSEYTSYFMDPRGDLRSVGKYLNLERQLEVSVFNIVAVAGGANHSLALRSDGTVWAWGDNNFGQLGDGGASGAESDTPVQVLDPGGGPDPLKNIKAIAAGGKHSLALDNNGVVWSWGLNNDGQLGNGSNVDQNVPVQVNAVGADVIAIAAGFAHSIAIDANNRVWAWGNNGRGQLGDNTTNNKNVPVSVLDSLGVGPLSDIKAITAGDAHSVAVENGGMVWAWGLNITGQLGNNNAPNDSAIPVQVLRDDGLNPPAILDNVKTISASVDGLHTLALRNNGTVWAWGDNSSGQLGADISFPNRVIAFQVSGLDVVNRIAAGYKHSLATNNNNEVWAWGDNSSGQLGDSGSCGLLCDTPTKLLTLTDVISISGGNGHTLASRFSNGKVWAWGSDSSEQLGNGPVNGDSPVPMLVSGF